jgi:signal peptidase II
MFQNKRQVGVNLVFAFLFILFLAVDRVTKGLAVQYLQAEEKELIPGVFSLHYLENRGAAWGMLQNAIWLFVLITVLVIAAMVYLYGRIPMDKKYYLLRFTIILLAAGAVGNFIDRIFWHYVVDFLYFKYINFPIFNVADCYVCIAAVLLIYCLLFRYKEDDFSWKKK